MDYHIERVDGNLATVRYGERVRTIPVQRFAASRAPTSSRGMPGRL